jgi:hypothetical protein
MSEIPKDVWLYKIVSHLNCDDISSLCRTYGWFRRLYTPEQRLFFLVDIPTSKRQLHEWHVAELHRLLVGKCTKRVHQANESPSFLLKTTGICRFCYGKWHPLTIEDCPFVTMEMIVNQPVVIATSNTTASTLQMKNWTTCKRCNVRDMCWKLVPWIVFPKVPVEKTFFKCINCGETVSQVSRAQFETGQQGCMQCKRYYCYKCIDVPCIGCNVRISPKLQADHLCAQSGDRWVVYLEKYYPAKDYNFIFHSGRDFIMVSEVNHKAPAYEEICFAYVNVAPDQLFRLLTRISENQKFTYNFQCPRDGVLVHDIYDKEPGQDILPILTLFQDGKGVNFKLIQ